MSAYKYPRQVVFVNSLPISGHWKDLVERIARQSQTGKFIDI